MKNRDGARRWLMHWLSALLVLFLLLTAMPLAILAGLRPPLRLWNAIHLSAGWALLVVTLLRLLTLAAGDARDAFANGKVRAAVKIALLVTLIVILAAGSVIYRPSPLQGAAYVFGVFEATRLANIGHALHLQLLALHRYASFILAALLVVHSTLAFNRTSPEAAIPMAWLWRMRRREPRL